MDADYGMRPTVYFPDGLGASWKRNTWDAITAISTAAAAVSTAVIAREDGKPWPAVGYGNASRTPPHVIQTAEIRKLAPRRLSAYEAVGPTR